MATNNDRRIKRARAAMRATVKGFRRGNYPDFESDVIDLITDLMHLAKSRGADVEMIQRCAATHIQAESK